MTQTPNRHLQLLTSSRMKDFRSCPRRHYYAYVLCVRPIKPAEALVMGTWFHKAVETYWRARKVSNDLRSCAIAAIDKLREIERGEGDSLDQPMAVRVRVMVAAYVTVWNTRTNVKPIEVEIPFVMPLMTPDGTESDFWQVSGKMDLIADFNGIVKVVEHKTSAADIDAGSDYRRKLTLDEQISVYLRAARYLGYKAHDVAYDVTRKSRKKPLKATPVEQREYTKEKSRVCKQCKKKNPPPFPHIDEDAGTACVDGRVITDPGGKLKANQRERDESMDEYKQRIASDGLDTMVEIVEIQRFQNELAKFEKNLYEQSELMRIAMDQNFHPQNSDACFQYHGSPCAYLPVCEGTASINDPTMYRRLDTAHPELEDENAKEI